MSDPIAETTNDLAREAPSFEPAAKPKALLTDMPPPLPMAAKPVKPSGLPKPYVALWGAAAVVSMGYLCVAILAPGLIGTDSKADGENAIIADRSGAQSVGSSTHARPSDRELEDNLTRARMEIAKLRTELTSRNQDGPQPAKPFSIENVKTSVAPATASPPQQAATEIAEATGNVVPAAPIAEALTPLAPPPERAEAVRPVLINQKAVETSTIASGESTATAPSAPAAASIAAAAENAAEEKTIAKATLLNGTPEPKPSAIETGSIRIPPPPVRGPERPQKLAQPVALQSPSVVKSALPDVKQAANAAARPVAAFAAPVIERAPPAPATSAGLGLRLARGASLEAIRLTWSLMNERHGAVLAGLEPRYVLVPGPSPSQPLYQLIAGPLIGAGEALQKCQDVSARGLPCEIGEYTGNAL